MVRGTGTPRQQCAPTVIVGDLCNGVTPRGSLFSRHQPAGRSVVNPAADIGDDGCNPQHRERAERAPSGARHACGSIARGPAPRCCRIGCSTIRMRVERPDKCCYVRRLLQ